MSGFPCTVVDPFGGGTRIFIHDAILLPLLVAFLAITVYGLYRGYQKHGRAAAVMLGGGSAVALLVFLLVFFSRPLAYLSIAGLVAASLLNVWLRTQEV